MRILTSKQDHCTRGLLDHKFEQCGSVNPAEEFHEPAREAIKVIRP
jgi:hypothetical protein